MIFAISTIYLTNPVYNPPRSGDSCKVQFKTMQVFLIPDEFKEYFLYVRPQLLTKSFGRGKLQNGWHGQRLTTIIFPCKVRHCGIQEFKMF